MAEADPFAKPPGYWTVISPSKERWHKMDGTPTVFTRFCKLYVPITACPKTLKPCECAPYHLKCEQDG